MYASGEKDAAQVRTENSFVSLAAASPSRE